MNVVVLSLLLSAFVSTAYATPFCISKLVDADELGGREAGIAANQSMMSLYDSLNTEALPAGFRGISAGRNSITLFAKSTILNNSEVEAVSVKRDGNKIVVSITGAKFNEKLVLSPQDYGYFIGSFPPGKLLSTLLSRSEQALKSKKFESVMTGAEDIPVFKGNLMGRFPYQYLLFNDAAKNAATKVGGFTEIRYSNK